MQLTKLAQSKLDELDDNGYTVNGVAIYNAETNMRGLVDRLGYVGWVTPASNPAAPAPVAGDVPRSLVEKAREQLEKSPVRRHVGLPPVPPATQCTAARGPSRLARAPMETARS